jgi:hypothetical protein
MNAATGHAEDRELLRLEVLHEYKKLFDCDGPRNVSPFEEDQVVRYGTDVGGCDVPEIHGEVRTKILRTLADIQAGKGSKVVILCGEPGMGKSHILNCFRDPRRADELGYVLVGNSNHWKAAEFEECLLDWMLAALVHPSPDGPHLLLNQIEAVAFQALAQVQAQPGRLTEYLPSGPASFLKRIWRKLGQVEVQDVQSLAERRNPKVFRKLDFDRFSGFVCDRFLHTPGNVFHRYVLRVLLRYLFVEDREWILNWLRRRPVRDYFLKRLGAAEEIDRNYKVIDTIKILMSLFSPEVGAGLTAPDGPNHRSRVFFFVFDQVEGRQELFDSEQDWFKFFAQLAELYNALPNVFILFTMTLGMRTILYPKMEVQFKDRIRHDPSFVLQRLENREVLALYRRRVAGWIGEGRKDLSDKITLAGYPYLPFEPGLVLEMAEQQTLRNMLVVFDEQFRKRMVEHRVKAALDHRVRLKELRGLESQADNEHQYPATHLLHVKELFERHGEFLTGAFGLRFNRAILCDQTAAPTLLELYFHAADDPSRWVRVFLSRLTPHFNRRAKACLDLLFHRHRNKNLLWLVRARSFELEVPEHLSRQVFTSFPLADVHTNLLAFLRMLERKADYPAPEWAEFQQVMLAELTRTYLGKLLTEVRRAAEDQRLKAVEEDPDAVAEPADVEAAAIAANEQEVIKVLSETED